MPRAPLGSTLYASDMDRRAAVVGLIWVLVLADSVWQGLTLPDLPHTNVWRFDSIGVLAVLMPVAFFSAMAFWIKGYPFDAPTLRTWVNRRFGDRSYETFLSKLRLLLLFSIASFVIGIVGLARASYLGAAEGAFVSGAFFVSSAIGFFVVRVVLAKRGLSFE